MLQKVFLYDHKIKRADILYIDIKNYNFDENKVYDLYLNKRKISSRLFEIIKSCILNQLHFGHDEDYVFTDPEVDIQLGPVIKTPDHLMDE